MVEGDTRPTRGLTVEGDKIPTEGIRRLRVTEYLQRESDG